MLIILTRWSGNEGLRAQLGRAAGAHLAPGTGGRGSPPGTGLPRVGLPRVEPPWAAPPGHREGKGPVAPAGSGPGASGN